MATLKFNAPATIERGMVTIQVPVVFQESVRQLIESSKIWGNIVHVELTRPKRPRTTGYRSQNSRFRGHCEDIARQITDDEGNPLYTPGSIAEAMKRMATDEGYPWTISLDGIREPQSTSQVTVEEMKLLIEVQQRFADEHNFSLTEYDEDGVPYQSVGGRTKQEMGKYHA